MHNLTRYYNFPPDESLRRALSEAVLQNPRYGAPLWILGGLSLVGLVVALTRRSDRWQVGVWVAGWAVFIGVAAFQNGISRAVTGIWYNNSPRLAAITPIGSLVLATSGFVWLRDVVAGRLAERQTSGSAEPARPTGRLAVAALITPVLLVAYVVLTGGNYVREHAARVKPYVHPYHPHDTLLTSREYAALQYLGPRVPRGALVADNPWRGQSLLYGIGGARVLFYSEKADNTPDRDLIAKELNLAGDPTRTDVCAAVRRTGIGYVITGGSNFLPDHQRITRYPGIDHVGRCTRLPARRYPRALLVVADPGVLAVLTTWVTAVAAVTLVLVGPGLAIARCLRLRGLAALATASGLTATLVGAAATLTGTGVTSLRWGLPLLVGATVVAALAAAGVGHLLPAPPARDRGGLRRAGVVGVGLGTLGLGPRPGPVDPAPGRRPRPAGRDVPPQLDPQHPAGGRRVEPGRRRLPLRPGPQLLPVDLPRPRRQRGPADRGPAGGGGQRALGRVRLARLDARLRAAVPAGLRPEPGGPGPRRGRRRELRGDAVLDRRLRSALAAGPRLLVGARPDRLPAQPAGAGRP